MTCPLCLHPKTLPFSKDNTRSYLQCSCCSLVFVPREELISEFSEKERYEAHENSEDDQGYVAYLKKITQSMEPYLKPGNLGLDYGCGKTTMLEKILESDGYQLNSYDLFFLPDEKVLEEKYDFIILSEVIEHLRYPHEALTKLTKMLKEDGQLFIKTKLLPLNKEEFDCWFYKRDSTHVQFFNEKSFLQLSRLLNLQPGQNIGEDLFLFRNH